jgi:homoserine dehydrogenase
VNVRAIAQGSSERNISVVIDARQTTRALRSVHARFYLSPHTISIGLVGPGVVGSVLLEQIASQAPRLLRDFRLDLRVRALMTSKKMVLSDQSIGLDGWKDKLAAGQPVDLAAFEDHVHADHLPHAVIIDCSASEAVAALYPRWLAEGIHVVTPNKRANSGALDLFGRLHEARRAGGSHYLYEATVGAGLPIMQTLRDLRETGDEIRKVEGIFSGTLAYLFNVWDGSEPFSSIVKTAKAKGYTEPDPRDDLSGTDVARKLVILAREMGMRLELADVALEGLIPPALVGVGVEEFMARLTELDAPMLAKLEAARAAQPRAALRRGARRGEQPRHRGAHGARALAPVRQHQPHRQRGAIRHLALRPEPARCAGPRCRPAVTAGGVFADLLRVCSYLGARSEPALAGGSRVVRLAAAPASSRNHDVRGAPSEGVAVFHAKDVAIPDRVRHGVTVSGVDRAVTERHPRTELDVDDVGAPGIEVGEIGLVAALHVPAHQLHDRSEPDGVRLIDGKARTDPVVQHRAGEMAVATRRRRRRSADREPDPELRFDRDDRREILTIEHRWIDAGVVRAQTLLRVSGREGHFHFGRHAGVGRIVEADLRSQPQIAQAALVREAAEARNEDWGCSHRSGICANSEKRSLTAISPPH